MLDAFQVSEIMQSSSEIVQAKWCQEAKEKKNHTQVCASWYFYDILHTSKGTH